MYPWFNLLVFKLSKGSKVTASGNFSIGHYDSHWINGYQYDIFFFDAHIQITKDSLNYSIVIEVPEELYDYHYFGNSTMTKIYFHGLTLRTFVGYASEQISCVTTPRRISFNAIPMAHQTLYVQKCTLSLFLFFLYVL